MISNRSWRGFFCGWEENYWHAALKTIGEPSIIERFVFSNNESVGFQCFSNLNCEEQLFDFFGIKRWKKYFTFASNLKVRHLKSVWDNGSDIKLIEWFIKVL